MTTKPTMYTIEFMNLLQKYSHGTRDEPERRVLTCRSSGGGRHRRAGGRRHGGCLLRRRGRPGLLNALGANRARRRGGEQENQNRRAHGGSLPSNVALLLQRRTVSLRVHLSDGCTRRHYLRFPHERVVPICCTLNGKTSDGRRDVCHTAAVNRPMGPP